MNKADRRDGKHRRWKYGVLAHLGFKKPAWRRWIANLRAATPPGVRRPARDGGGPCLIVRLPADDRGEIEWQVRSQTEDAVLAQGSGDIEQARHALAGFSPAGITRVLAPTTEVTLHRVTLPRLARRQLAQALPFILEDQFATEVEQLHFAVLEKQGDEGTIAVVEKSTMRHWQRQCRALGIVADTLLPDAWVLPRAQDGWSALNHRDLWLFRRENGLAMAVESSWSDALLGAFSPAPQGDSYSATAPAGEWRRRPETDLFQLAAKTPLPRAPADLQQGEFAPATSWRLALRPWRGVAVAALCYLLLLMGQAGWTHYQLYQQAERWRQESVRVYQQIFPTETRVVNPRAQMQQHLQQAVATKGTPGLLEQLTPLQRLLTQNGGVQIQSLSYDGAALRLTIRATSYQALEQFQQQSAVYYQVQSGDMRQENQYVEGRLTLRGKP
ncbi:MULTISPECIES: type II secretion system protein GspL [unclassified Brenneria]|uniref:type II secretion system protein GspL n=1 Tax=unclassified Brenneria TaxID=2634434 RepID=UPI0018F0F82E|nr:type II secretion system protein GspL [Brenneria sp. L3-3C-1]MBJ7221457.1 type II secretion system protein GspL [Brenneria sp. L3-3C-1]MEE3642699.1 type II secretion system protein GspL [Brenneria sp. L3_3C_1]